jgi:hypothetical protein
MLSKVSVGEIRNKNVRHPFSNTHHLVTQNKNKIACYRNRQTETLDIDILVGQYEIYPYN